jgi:PAS fold
VSQSLLDAGLVRWFSEYADQGIFTSDRELIVTGWNRWLERHSGRSAAEVVGRSILDALHCGTITASSAGPGVGSSFVVSLPALAAGRADEPANDAIWVRRAPGRATET